MLPKRRAHGAVDLVPLAVSQCEEVLCLPSTFRAVLVDRVALNAGVWAAFPDKPRTTPDLRIAPAASRALRMPSRVRRSEAVFSASPGSPSWTLHTVTRCTAVYPEFGTCSAQATVVPGGCQQSARVHVANVLCCTAPGSGSARGEESGRSADARRSPALLQGGRSETGRALGRFNSGGHGGGTPAGRGLR